ncbi:MAG: hypothetical protein ACYSRQ_00245 [Planctomycetota bacterium]|jgi:hypothetical protein
MESTSQQVTTGSDENEPILHVERSLIPLEEYAEREGVSISIILECAKTGIVQIRKCRGNSYVVDVPLSPHVMHLETKNGIKDGDGSISSTKSLSEKIKEFSSPKDFNCRQAELDEIMREKMESRPSLFKTTYEACLESSSKSRDEATDQLSEMEHLKSTAVEAENPRVHDYSGGFLDEYILEQIETSEAFRREVGLEQPQEQEEIDDDDIIEMLELEPPEAVQIIDEPISEKTIDEMWDEPIRIPDLEVPSQPSGGNRPIEKIEEEQGFKEERIKKEEGRRIDAKYILQTRRFWQVMTSFALLLFIAAICVTVWVYSDHRVQQGRLNEAYASIQSVYNDFIEQKETSNTLQEQLDKAQTRLMQLQNELGQSNAQVRTLKAQLYQGQEALDGQGGLDSQQLKDQIEDLTGQINNLAGN